MNTISTKTILNLSSKLSLASFSDRFKGLKPFYKSSTVTKYYTEEGDVVTFIEVEKPVDVVSWLVTLNTVNVLYSEWGDYRYLW